MKLTIGLLAYTTPDVGMKISSMNESVDLCYRCLFAECATGGTTHSQLVQLVDESADRRRHCAVSACAIFVDTDNTPPAGRLLRDTIPARCSPASVPRKCNTTTSRRWFVVILLTNVISMPGTLILWSGPDCIMDSHIYLAFLKISSSS